MPRTIRWHKKTHTAVARQAEQLCFGQEVVKQQRGTYSKSFEGQGFRHRKHFWKSTKSWGTTLGVGGVRGQRLKNSQLRYITPELIIEHREKVGTVLHWRNAQTIMPLALIGTQCGSKRHISMRHVWLARLHRWRGSQVLPVQDKTSCWDFNAARGRGEALMAGKTKGGTQDPLIKEPAIIKMRLILLLPLVPCHFVLESSTAKGPLHLLRHLSFHFLSQRFPDSVKISRIVDYSQQSVSKPYKWEVWCLRPGS